MQIFAKLEIFVAEYKPRILRKIERFEEPVVNYRYRLVFLAVVERRKFATGEIRIDAHAPIDVARNGIDPIISHKVHKVSSIPWTSCTL